eukprot:TRINITY_DN104255_c0_g1_i1.p1 TRINITY_DN104255_c0_g1~~TRINITY_DN104255_c0_g1_i1.p1  ORF type:complete len:420 (-),score=70.68 TRINITY_DN104255_c0_g1_i1:74-1333(-)
MVRLSTEECWHWWRQNLGNPKYICAPMVRQSELAFRMMVRQHGTCLCYTPMIPVKTFLACPESSDDMEADPETGDPVTQADYFSTCPQDRPLFAQFGGRDPGDILEAALLVQDRVDAVDLNLGCPQRSAQRDRTGAYLMDEPHRVQRILKKLVANLKVPVTAKIRVFPDVKQTVDFALMLQDTGIAALAVHGRRREQRHHEGAADWDAIAAVKSALAIPVIANGNILKRQDADTCMKITGADAVMSATTLLSNPHLFAKRDSLHETFEGRIELALEYLRYCEKYPDGTLPRMISDHMLTILRPDLDTPEAADMKTMFKAFPRLLHAWQYKELVRHLSGQTNDDSFNALAEVAKKPTNNKPSKKMRDKIRRRASGHCMAKFARFLRSVFALLSIPMERALALGLGASASKTSNMMFGLPA